MLPTLADSAMDHPAASSDPCPSPSAPVADPAPGTGVAARAPHQAAPNAERRSGALRAAQLLEQVRAGVAPIAILAAIEEAQLPTRERVTVIDALLARPSLDPMDLVAIYQVAPSADPCVRGVIEHPAATADVWLAIAAAPRRPMDRILVARHDEARTTPDVRLVLRGSGDGIALRYLLRDERGDDLFTLWLALVRLAPREALRAIEDPLLARRLERLPPSAVVALEDVADVDVRLRAAPYIRAARAGIPLREARPGGADVASVSLRPRERRREG